MIKYAAAEILSTEMGGRTTLRHLAHRADFTYTPRPGYLYVRSRAISSRTNDNYDDFPAEEIEKGYRSFIGKPVFVNHSNEDHKRAHGVIIDAALHHDVNPNGSPDTWCEVLMEVDAIRFPKLAKAIVLGHIDRTSMGVDVEYSICSACGNRATNPAEYCRHIPQMKGSKIVRRNASTGRPEEQLIFETCYGLSFFENSLLVEDPADPTALTLGVDTRGISGNVGPRLPLADHADYRLSYVESKSDVRHGQLAATGSSLADSDLSQEPSNLANFIISESGLTVPEPFGLPVPLDHVSGVISIGAQEPVGGIVAQQHVAGVADDEALGDGTDQLLVSPAMRAHRASHGIGQGEASIPAVEDSAGPGPASLRSMGGIDLGQIPVHLGLSSDELSGGRVSDHRDHFKRSVRPQEGLGAFVAVDDLDEAVTSFKPYAEQQGWHDPACVGGQCDVASVEFAEHLHNRGIPHEVVTHYPKPGGSMSHSVVEVGDRTVDWTARQHDPAADFPHIEPHHVTRSRWHRSEPYYGEIEYGQHKYGSEHMGLLSFVAAYDQDEDLTTKSPGEIDGSLAEHHDKYFGHENAQKSAIDSMHHATGDRQRSQGRRWAWGKTDEEVHNTDPATLKPWDQRSFESAKTRHADAGQGLREEAGHIQRHEDEFSRRGGWSRFFTVQDGHIHSSRQCHSCRPTTKFGWQPELSGKSEKEAVDDKGPYLCTHCFKSAPTEWKRDPTEVKAEEKRQSGGLCPGGTASHYLSHEEVTERKAAHPQGKISLGPGEAHYFGQQKGMLGRCPSCRSLQKVKNSGDFYNHKPPEPPKEEPKPKPVVMTPPREEPKPEPTPKSTDFGPGMVDQLPHPTEKKLKSHLNKDHQIPYPALKNIERRKTLMAAHDEMHEGPNSWVTNGHTHPETKEAGLHAFVGAFPFELRVTAVEISVAGLAVVARDTGRVLMLQRLLDGTDPAGGTWEFPGGHMDEGEAPIEGAIREWKEELGCPLPHGKVGGHWISKGIYQGSVYVIEHEDEVKINDDHEDRKVLNPDDPDGDGIEVAAWWDPKDLPDMPALRPECKNTDWDLFKPSAIEKVAAKSWPDVQWMMEGGSQYLTGVGAEVTHSPGFYETADSNPEDRHRVRKVIHQINRSKPLSDVLYHGHTEDQDSFTERHKVGDEMHIPLMATTPQKQLAHAYGTPASHTRPNGSQNSNQSVIYHFHQPKSVHVRDNERVISGRYRITGIEDGDEVPHSGGQLAFDENGHPKISGDKVETMPPKRRKNVHLDYQGPLQVHPEEPQSYDDDDDYGHEAGLNGFVAVDVQDRLFDVKQYPTKKGPYQEPKRNPEFEQPDEGIIGKYLYHHSPPENRASIMEHGLQPHDPQESSAKGSDIPEEDTPHGVYLGPYDSISPHKSHHDIWAVDSNQVHLHHDPDDRENYWGFHYSEHPIPPDAMHLVHRAGEEHTAGLWAFAADASEFYHGTSDELAPGAQLSVEEAAKQQPEVAQALEHQGGQHISFTTDYKHAEMYAGIRAQTRGGTPHVYRVRPTGGYEPNPADEKWREGKPPMSFRTREPVTVLGEATPPKRRRKKAGLEAFAMDETGDPPTAHIPTAMERWQGETVHQPIAAAWKAMGAPMGAGAKDQYPERYEPNKGFGVHLKNGETETKSSTSPEGVASQYDVTPVPWADRDKHEIETGMPSMSYPDGVPRINAKVPGSERPLDHVYRIMHDDEYQQAKQRGYFKSDERMNLSNEGTVASEGSTGSFYAAPGPNRIVRLQHHPEDGWKRDSDNYIKTHQKIPFHRADLISPIIHNHQEIKGDPKRSHSVVDNFHIEGLEHEAPHLQKQSARPNIGKGWWLTPEGKKISVYDHYETTPGMARQMIRPHMAESGQVRVRSFNNQLNVQTSRPFTDKQRQSLLMDADRHSRVFVDVLHPDTEESIHSESGGSEDADRMLARAHRAAVPHTAKLSQQEERLFDPGSLHDPHDEHLPNPLGGHDWHHGSPHDFHSFEDEREYDDDWDETPEHNPHHWNTHLGTHWTSIERTAEKFAKGKYSNYDEGPGHVFTANLGIKNPKHYDKESDMDTEAFHHAWDGHDPEDIHSQVCKTCPPREKDEFDDDPQEHHWLYGRPATEHLEHHKLGDEVDNKIKQHYYEQGGGNGDGWLSDHPDAASNAEEFKAHLKSQGHDGVTYGNGNATEGPLGHLCAISFEHHQIHNLRRRRLGMTAGLGGFVAELSEEGRVSVAEQIMERGGHGGRDWYIPRLHQDDPTRTEQHQPVHDFVHGVLAANGHNPEMTPHVRVVPEHWDLRGGAQGSTDGMNYIGVHSHTNDLTLLHETAHILTRTPEGPGGHGPEFRSTVQKLYHDHISPEAGQMFGELANPPQAHEAMAWQEQGGRGGMTAEQAGARSVRDAGFKGYVGQSNWDEDEGGDDTHHFDEDLYDKVTPEPTPEEEEHYQKHDDYPDSYMERHDQAYSDALGKKQQEDEPDHTDDHLHHWIQEHSQDANEWRKHAKQPQQVDLRKGVYATQSHVGQFHIDRYLHGGEDEPSWHSQSGGQAHDYLGESHPLFVTHQGRLHAIEGHHRIAAALQRGDNHIQGWHHDLDKHPIAGYDKQGNGCEECEGYYDWDKDEHHLAAYHDTGQWEEPPRTLPNGDSVSGYGDAVPGGYNESLRAFHPDTGEETGRLDVNTARHDPEHLVAWMHTPEEHRGRGTMTHLLEHYRQHHLPPGEHLNFGMTTPEGQAWIDKHQPKTSGLDGFVADDEDWRGQHQPSMGPPIHNLLEPDESGGSVAPNDIYTHMHYYTDGEDKWDSESHAAIQAARGDRPLHQRPAAPAKMFSERAGGGEMTPAREAESDESFARRKQRRADGEHHVTIYRAAPKGLKSIGPGDWVTPSPSYARDHARHATDPKKDWPVYKARVPAKHVRWAGDSLNEFGYNGPEVKPTYHTRGGTQAERLAAFVIEADQPYRGGFQFKFRQAAPGGMEAQADKTLNYHQLEAFHSSQDPAQDRAAGLLLWHHRTGEINTIEVGRSHQRQGLATEMLDQARQISATTRGVKPPKHSNQRTDAGEAWARSTGDRLPRRVQGLADFALSGAS